MVQARRWATPDDLPALRAVMALAIDRLQRDYLSAAQIAASHAVMGLDSQLIADGTYLVVEIDGRIAGCGGWSRRGTLYGGDQATALREPRLLDPAQEAARMRAMYTHPNFARRGIGAAILSTCEAAARANGFTRAELMATLAGEPLYRACGYTQIAAEDAEVDGVRVPLIRMVKALDKD